MNQNKPAVVKKLQERFRNISVGRGLYIAFVMPTMLSMFSTRAFAADTICTKASAIMQDVYKQILSISTIAAVVTAAVALLLMNFSRSGRTVDESRAWLKRIIITWAILNSLGFIMAYCAYKDTDATSISKDDMESLLAANKDKLYSFTYTDEVREVPSEPEAESTETVAPDTTTEEPPEPTYETIRVYTISYNGEAYFADQVFHLSDDQKLLASQYAQNLTVLLGDGVYQGLSETEFSALGLSYDGVIFSDGETQVVYYNQLDERWKYELYGTDTIGGYACGPTAMSIVVSSLTSETVDPPHMAQWAYENGYWCSGNGSYHSLIPGAAEAWGLSVEGCTATEPQRIVDALADGKLVVAIMTKGHFTSSGHFIVLRGCTADGKILVADPSSYKRSEKSWDMSIILNEASKRAGSGGPFWIIGN